MEPFFAMKGMAFYSGFFKFSHGLNFPSTMDKNKTPFCEFPCFGV
jgi:hypothetical protein